MGPEERSRDQEFGSYSPESALGGETWSLLSLRQEVHRALEVMLFLIFPSACLTLLKQCPLKEGNMAAPSLSQFLFKILLKYKLTDCTLYTSCG